MFQRLRLKSVAPMAPHCRSFSTTLVRGSTGAAAGGGSGGDSGPSTVPPQPKAWQKWINYNSPHRSESDEMNRKRHYFWYLDERGRLYRRELNYPSSLGEMTMARVKNQMLSSIDVNTINPEYASRGYRYVSALAHELNFIGTQDSIAAVVFHNLLPGAHGTATTTAATGTAATPANPLHRTSTAGAYRATTGGAGGTPPPHEQYVLLYANSETIPFDPTKLRLHAGRLYHPFVRPGYRKARALAPDPNSKAVGPVRPETSGERTERAEAAREREQLLGAAAASTARDEPILFGLLDRNLTQSLAIDEVLAVHRPAQTHAGLPPPAMQYVFSWLGQQHAVPPVPRLLLAPLTNKPTAPATDKAIAK